VSERVLEGKVALIAGGGRGIGRAIAVAYARAGAQVAVAARTKDQLDETAALCQAVGARTFVAISDVSDWPGVEALEAEVRSELGPVEVLVNAAGIYGPIGPTAEVDPGAWARALNVNLIGAFHLCRAVAPGMADRRCGKIVLLGGGGATAPLPSFSAYAASKAAVVRLAETLAVELAPQNVQVNAVAPGLVDTQMQDEVLAAGELAGPLLEKIREARETGSGAVPPEVAAALAVFLASDASGDLTGKLIAAPHDRWAEWRPPFDRLNASTQFTIRRLDPHTVTPVLHELRENG
jgi:NAD(P)-dependent dehydrogenase (short-subunit alcohol dehydrogenase family)